jgi:hypothetical protein
MSTEALWPLDHGLSQAVGCYKMNRSVADARGLRGSWAERGRQGLTSPRRKGRSHLIPHQPRAQSPVHAAP